MDPVANGEHKKKKQGKSTEGNQQTLYIRGGFQAPEQQWSTIAGDKHEDLWEGWYLGRNREEQLPVAVREPAALSEGRPASWNKLPVTGAVRAAGTK